MAAWDALPNESAAAYEAFCAYRDLGPERTALVAFRQVRSKPEAKNLGGNWAAWSSEHHWKERAEAYDAWLERSAREKADADAIKRRAAMLVRHRQAAELMQRRGIEHFANSKVETARDAISAIKTGVDLERQVEGLPQWVGEILNADADRLRSILADLDGGLAARASPGDAAAVGAGAGTNGNGH